MYALPSSVTVQPCCCGHEVLSLSIRCASVHPLYSQLQNYLHTRLQLFLWLVSRTLDIYVEIQLLIKFRKLPLSLKKIK